jgi:hypothetical protein
LTVPAPVGFAFPVHYNAVRGIVSITATIRRYGLNLQ